MAFVESPYLSDVFKEDDLVAALKLKQRSGGKDLCSLDDEELIDDCDMSIYATEIFSTIMSDVFKIKYAQVLDIENIEARFVFFAADQAADIQARPFIPCFERR